MAKGEGAKRHSGAREARTALVRLLLGHDVILAEDLGVEFRLERA
jgi:hypothetical protein